MKKHSALFSLCLLCVSPAFSQQTQQTSPSQPVTAQQSITVTTTVEPVPLSANDRSVTVIDTTETPLAFNSVVDYLRTDPSLDLQSRAANGVQADVSLRGTTFEQSLVLLNGMRINDPETGHLNLDIPVPLEAVGRVDVLHGSGSTFYGSDAIGGAVNLITLRPVSSSVIAKIGFGNYASEEQHLTAAYVANRWATQLTGSRDASDGFIADRGYHANALAEETWFTTKLGTTDVLFAGSDRPYGANQFYGPYDSTERTKGWFSSIQQQLGQRTAASFGYRRHTDLFVLFAGQPLIYENNHITQSYEGALRRVDNLGKNATISYGLEQDGDNILSTNLGKHARNQGAGYANLEVRSVPHITRLSLSLGAREEVLSGKGSVFSPSFAAAYAVTNTLRLRGSIGHGFRQPTYLDLYYSDPTTIGNPALQPESCWTYDGGFDVNPGGRIMLSATGFHIQQNNGIDYSKYSLAAKWQANNIPSLAYSGAETTLRIRLNKSQQLQLGYAAVRTSPPPPGLISEYAFNYAAQNATAAWTLQPTSQLLLRTQLSVVQKTGQTAYPVWDVSASRTTGRIRPYLRLLNLSNTGYQEIPGVPVQGRTIMAGVQLNWSPIKH